MIRAAILLALATPAQAQQACAPLPDALTALASRYAEAPRAQGLMADGRLMVITAADAGGWTAMVVTPEGQACMVAAGEAFGIVEAPKPGSDS